MSCADVCLSHDGDGCDFWTSRMAKARKEHKCRECGEPIAVGETYERSAGKSEGDFYSHTVCAPCAEIRDAFVCGGFIYGRLWESIREGMFPVWRKRGEYDCLAKLTTPEAIARCNAEYREWLTDNEYDTGPEGEG